MAPKTKCATNRKRDHFKSRAANTPPRRCDAVKHKAPHRGGKLQDRMTFPSGELAKHRAAPEGHKQAGNDVFKRSQKKADISKSKDPETAFRMKASHKASLSTNGLAIRTSSTSKSEDTTRHAATSATISNDSLLHTHASSSFPSVIHRVSQCGAISKPKSTFPVNTYKGNDPIKRRVQNKKLQAIFADKPIPRERKVAREERPVLRIGMTRELR